MGLKKEELVRLRNRKRELRNALRNCGIGDSYSKEYIKAAIENILVGKLGITEDNINNIINFNNIPRLTIKDKFDILMYQYKLLYGSNAFQKMTDEFDLLEPVKVSGGFKYEISQSDIDEIFAIKAMNLSYQQKKDVLVQRIYEKYRGLGVVDELRDMKIDGISGGVSGKEGDNNSIWIFIKGKTVHLSFLAFESEKELQRICMNIYKYNSPGQLSMSKGYIVNEMKDHSRVVVARPPFCESFVFFVRKFDTIEHKTLEELIKGDNYEIVISFLKLLVHGCQITAITGTQGCGKTTLLMALIGYIHPSFTLRIQELAFELHLRDIYPDRNIVTFQETDYISGQEGLDIQKKTDGVVNILGEVATAPVAAWLVQMSMVASLFTMFTHHAKTTKDLVKYMRNSLLMEAGFKNEIIAEEQVVDAIRFDIHLEKDINGNRFIERITEIVPNNNDRLMNEITKADNGIMFKTNNIIEYKDGKYVVCNCLSDMTRQSMFKTLTKEEMKEFSEIFSL